MTLRRRGEEASRAVAECRVDRCVTCNPRAVVGGRRECPRVARLGARVSLRVLFVSGELDERSRASPEDVCVCAPCCPSARRVQLIFAAAFPFLVKF